MKCEKEWWMVLLRLVHHQASKQIIIVWVILLCEYSSPQPSSQGQHYISHSKYTCVDLFTAR